MDEGFIVIMIAMQSPRFVPATDLERETGLGKDLLRKWRERYGFPVPQRAINGTQGYSRDQVRQLRSIKRLLDAGFRPAQVVGKTVAELEQLLRALSCEDTKLHWNRCTQEVIEKLKQHDLAGVNVILAKQLSKGSLGDFVRDTVAPLIVAIGEAWVRGDIEVYHEHLCSDLLIRCLHAELRALKPKRGFPRILLAAPPEELHVLGLLMAEAVLAERGAHCMSVGPQLAMGDLAMAVQACKPDILAISFSAAYPARRVRPTLAHLRELLPGQVQIWVGGSGAAHIRRPPKGVLIFGDLQSVTSELLERVTSGRR
ncbi:MAG: MerR family transcriptional regulator [Rhodocyclales bacterium]|nr:MerR family transcriptional regulator [Rhodocyclales bacterium]